MPPRPTAGPARGLIETLENEMLKIRLRRMGNRNRPFYRVVVSDSRKVPTANAVEEIGHYDPHQDPKDATIDVDRADHWISHGARVTPTVAKLLAHKRPSA